MSWAFLVTVMVVVLALIARVTMLEQDLRRMKNINISLVYKLKQFGVRVTIDPKAVGMEGIYYTVADTCFVATKPDWPVERRDHYPWG